MNKDVILHVLYDSPILTDFIDFMEVNFRSNHKFITFIASPTYLKNKNILILNINKIPYFFNFLIYLNTSNKIILHGLFDFRMVLILFFQPWLFKKCYWAMWGGDFYFPEKQHWIKKYVMKHIGHLITYIKGEYQLAQQWYGVTGKYHECFMYPSNLYKEHTIHNKADKTINIQIGNSADPSNNHLEIFEKLRPFKNKNIKIFAPLSYGNQIYAKKMASEGQKIFGTKFIPIWNFMAYNEYLAYLETIDITIFAHNRQQGMGNTITLLGLGKKIYMKSTVTSYKMFEEIGIKVFDLSSISIELLDEGIKQQNANAIKEYFSSEKLIYQLNTIYLERE